MPNLTADQSFLINNVAQLDEHGNPLTTPDPSYGSPVFVNSNPDVVTMVVNRAVPTGVLGSATITTTETSTDSTKPTLTGNPIILNVVGPTAAALSVSGIVVDGH